MTYRLSPKYLLAFLIGATSFLTSCGEDRTYQFEEKTGKNQWIYSIMNQWYLWNDEIPQMTTTQFFGDSEAFFKKLLSKKDKYSYMETNEEETTRSINLSSSYGIDFALYVDPVTNSKSTIERFARVLYILPNSPADQAGLKRGDWISAIGGQQLTTKNYLSLINGPATTITTSRIRHMGDKTLTWEEGNTVEMEASRHLEDNPFYVDSIYHIRGKKIAYLMYNRFSTGPNDTGNETQYNAQMRNIFATFKKAEVDDVILDLRYNPGGYLSCAQVMASLLTPEQAFGKIFCTLKFNENNASRNEAMMLDKSLTGGANLNLKRLYIITSSLTASASESIINGLRPFMGEENIILVGTRTEGKNVASLAFNSSSYGFILHPIVATVYNGNGESNYANGFAPNVEVDELMVEYDQDGYAIPLLPLGDPNETLLNTALSLILGEDANAQQPNTRSGISTPYPTFNSVHYKYGNNLLIN